MKRENVFLILSHGYLVIMTT